MGFSYKVVVILEPTIVRVMSMKSTDMLLSVKIQVRQLLFTASLKLVNWASSSAVLWWSNGTQQPMSSSINMKSNKRETGNRETNWCRNKAEYVSISSIGNW